MKGASLKPLATREGICKSAVINYLPEKELLRNHRDGALPGRESAPAAHTSRRTSRARCIKPAGNGPFSPRMLPGRPQKSRCIRYFIYVTIIIFDVGSERQPPSFRFALKGGASPRRAGAVDNAIRFACNVDGDRPLAPAPLIGPPRHRGWAAGPVRDAKRGFSPSSCGSSQAF